MDTPTETGLDGAKLLKLTQWLSPSFPVGAYAYSHGLEWAVEAGDVVDRVSAEAWIIDLLARGAGRNDGIFLAHAYGANDGTQLEEIAELAEAFVTGAERLRETMEMGAALRKGIFGIAESGMPVEGCVYSQLNRDWSAAYPVVLGVAARGHELPLGPTLSLFLHSFGANLVFAAQRLVPLGQIEGQQIVATLASVIEELVTEILAASLDDLGGCAFAGDMASMAHETQKVRLFRT